MRERETKSKSKQYSTEGIRGNSFIWFHGIIPSTTGGHRVRKKGIIFFILYLSEDIERCDGLASN